MAINDDVESCGTIIETRRHSVRVGLTLFSHLPLIIKVGTAFRLYTAFAPESYRLGSNL